MSTNTTASPHVPTPPPSSSGHTPEHESSDSEKSSHTTTCRRFTMTSLPIPEDASQKSAKRFGTAIQQFSQDLTKSLNRYQISEKLTDRNFSQWSQPILEVLIGLDYLGYVKKTTYRDSSLSDAEHHKVKFLLTTWLLNLMDGENTRRCRVHLTTRASNQTDSSDDPDDSDDEDSRLMMSYEPALLWKFLKSHHQAISESSLSVIDETLHSLKVASTDSIVAHMESSTT